MFATKNFKQSNGISLLGLILQMIQPQPEHTCTRKSLKFYKCFIGLAPVRNSNHGAAKVSEIVFLKREKVSSICNKT